MKKLLALLLLIPSAAVAADHPRNYLLSIGKIPLKYGESIESFSIKTWGVIFVAVCHIPNSWKIKAGSSATPDGEIDGEGSVGASWFSRSSPSELRNFLLVTMYGPVQRADIGLPDRGVPATFKGTATIITDYADVSRTLTYRNITLTPAHRCPVN